MYMGTGIILSVSNYHEICLWSLDTWSDIAQSKNIARLHYQIKDCDKILEV